MNKSVDMDKYADIIDVAYKKSTRHKAMDIIDRAAQFNAFQALTGYDDAVKKTQKQVCERANEDRIEEITIC